MRIVFVTQKVDAEDPVLGATVAKIAALAARCDDVRVLALAEGRHDLPPNVSVGTFGARTRVGRGLRYARLLLPELARRPDAVLAHMAPVYAILAAPLARPLGVPILLWYTHWAATPSLRLATALSSRVLSVDRTSFPLDSAKLTAIGHGIDVAEFSPARRAGGPPVFLALGRLSPTKGLDVVLEGFQLARARGLEATLELRGTASTEPERDYRRRLEKLVADGVRLEEPVPRSEVPLLLGRFDALVNAHAGTLDKVVYEAAAAGLPPIACSPGFAELLDGLALDLRFPCGDADELAERLLQFAASPADAREEAARELRRRVEARHSAETWAEGVLSSI